MSNGTQKLNWVSEFWRFQDFSVKINDFGALIFQELLFSNIFVDLLQKQFSCIGGKHGENQHCGFQKKAIKQKKFKRLEMNTQRCKKIKGNGDAIWWMLNKQTNKQNKHPLMQTVFFLLLCTTYNDLKQLCASTQAFDGTYT